MPDGVLYVARGDGYLEAAVESAMSVRAVTPALALAIATDGPAPAIFDTAIPLTERDGYRAKVVAMMESPFDRTLYLDVDTFAAEDVSELFRLLDGFDMALAHAPNRVTLALDDVPDAFPEFNTGVIAFRRTAGVERLLAAWLEEFDRLAPLNAPTKDQSAFRRVAYSAKDVRLAVLPPEFNTRFNMAGFVNQKVRILHGWAEPTSYRAVAGLLNDRVAGWRHRAVFIGRTLLDEHGEAVGTFPKRLRSPRTRKVR
jgi:hypothetical protein